MALSNLFGWTKKAAPTACGAACGASDKPKEAPAACGAAAPEKPAACGASDKPTACGSACGAGEKK
jgi:ACGX-repeat protein